MVILGLLPLLAAGCGGGSPAAESTNGPTGPRSTSGTVAAVALFHLEVQTAAGRHVRLNYGSTTRITRAVHANRSSLTIGSCVTVLRLTNPASGPPATATATISARAVTITTATARGCGAGGGRNAAVNGGTMRGASSNAPRGATSMPRPARGRGFPGTFGKVTAISAASFVVAGRQGGNAASGTTATLTVATTPATRYTVTEVATAAALAVGECITAIGPSGDSAVTARSIRIRPPGTNGCPPDVTATQTAAADHT